MLQSKPPEWRQGKPFRSFTEVLLHILNNEGTCRLFKGLAPQIMKRFLVQGLMMMLKERYAELITCNLCLSLFVRTDHWNSMKTLLMLLISLHWRRRNRFSTPKRARRLWWVKIIHNKFCLVTSYVTATLFFVSFILYLAYGPFEQKAQAPQRAKLAVLLHSQAKYGSFGTAQPA